ncbi:hypothetical protein Tco_1203135 [Tanacetum coccineum]
MPDLLTVTENVEDGKHTEFMLMMTCLWLKIAMFPNDQALSREKSLDCSTYSQPLLLCPTENPKFTSRFGKALQESLGNSSLSSVQHFILKPMVISERNIHTLEDMPEGLNAWNGHVVWDEYLCWKEFAYNNRVEFEVEPHEDHTFEVEPHGNVDHVVGSQEKAGLKDDMDAQSDVYVLSNGCKKCSDDSDGYYWESTPCIFIHLFLYIDGMVFSCRCKAEIWITKGLLSRIHNEKLVQTLLNGHSILSLEGSLSGDRDVEKNDFQPPRKLSHELPHSAGSLLLDTCPYNVLFHRIHNKSHPEGGIGPGSLLPPVLLLVLVVVSVAVVVVVGVIVVGVSLVVFPFPFITFTNSSSPTLNCLLNQFTGHVDGIMQNCRL